MKRKAMIFFMAGIICCTAGCGSKKEESLAPAENSESKMNEAESEAEPETETKEQAANGKSALAGVYENGEELLTIPMGTFFNGSQNNYCNIPMPSNYIFSSIYIDENGEEQSNMDISGMPVELALERGADSQPNANQRVGLTSPSEDGTNIIVTVMDSGMMNYDDIKEYATNEVEFAEDALYYVDEQKYAPDLNMCRIINEDIFVSITYDGPLAEELGLDQLAQNLYDLVEVIN